jgi:hypothetical protein
MIAVGLLAAVALGACSSASKSHTLPAATTSPTTDRRAGTTTTVKPEVTVTTVKLASCQTAVSALVHAMPSGEWRSDTFATPTMKALGLTSLRACGPSNGGQGLAQWVGAAQAVNMPPGVSGGQAEDAAAAICSFVDRQHSTSICQDHRLKGIDGN